jgi:hypothetical protein
MTFLETLQTHKGSLLRLKTQLYWYDGRGYDNNPGRVCLILDATVRLPAAVVAACAAAAATAAVPATFLLIDGQPQWVWVAEQDVELL